MATLNDVAKAAGVDPSTASRILRNDPNQVVREETRRRVHVAAEALSYRPNSIARALRTHKTDTLGLITPRFSDFAFTDVLRGIQSEAVEHDRLLIVVEWDTVGEDAKREREVLSRLLGDGIIDGLLVAFATIEDTLLPEWIPGPIPLVMVNRRAEGVVGSVTTDDFGAARLATKYLADLGHSKIGYIGLPSGTSTSEGRRNGFVAAMEEARLEIDPDWTAVAGSGLEGGKTSLREIMKRGEGGIPTALVVASIRPAISVLSELGQMGVEVPRAMSVIAVGDNAIANISSPRLTTVRLPFEEMGRESVRMLLSAIDGVPPLDVRLEQPPELVVRASTAEPTWKEGRP